MDDGVAMVAAAAAEVAMKLRLFMGALSFWRKERVLRGGGTGPAMSLFRKQYGCGIHNAGDLE